MTASIHIELCCWTMQYADSAYISEKVTVVTLLKVGLSEK